MKQKDKALPKERNIFAVRAKFRKAGAHQKSTKALRRKQNQIDKKEMMSSIDWA